MGGADAADFLGDLVTATSSGSAPLGAVYGALLTPQGKILLDFISSTRASGVLLDSRGRSAAAFVERLGLYRLRAR